jgi:hypothetical protein
VQGHVAEVANMSDVCSVAGSAATSGPAKRSKGGAAAEKRSRTGFSAAMLKKHEDLQLVIQPPDVFSDLQPLEFLKLRDGLKESYKVALETNGGDKSDLVHYGQVSDKLSSANGVLVREKTSIEKDMNRRLESMRVSHATLSSMENYSAFNELEAAQKEHQLHLEDLSKIRAKLKLDLDAVMYVNENAVGKNKRQSSQIRYLKGKVRREAYTCSHSDLE